MTHLVIGYTASFFIIENAAFLFKARHDSFNCSCKVIEINGNSVTARRHDRGFVHKIGNISAGKAGCQSSDYFEIYVFVELNVANMHLENF